MIDSLLYVFNPANFEPHRIHFTQTPILFWVLVLGNLLIFISYVLIPIALLYLVRKRKDIMFTPIFCLFAAFIVLCGTYHLMHVISFWYPIYGIEAVWGVITGLVSIGTFFAVLYVLPLALKLKSPRELEEINAKLAMEIQHSKKAEEELRQKNQKLETLTKEVIEKNEELEKNNKLMVERELKMIELKKEVAELKNKKL